MVRKIWSDERLGSNLISADSVYDFEPVEDTVYGKPTYEVKGSRKLIGGYDDVTVEWDGTLPAFFEISHFSVDNGCIWMVKERVKNVPKWILNMVSYVHDIMTTLLEIPIKE